MTPAPQPGVVTDADLLAMPSDWRFCAVGRNKQPIDGNGWGLRCVDRDADYYLQLNGTRPPALGLLLNATTGTLAIDRDDEGWEQAFRELTGRDINDLPRTIAWTSGKPGRQQQAFTVPLDWQPLIDGKKIHNPAGQVALEVRWGGAAGSQVQSVVCGFHPETGAYRWVEGCSPQELGDPAVAPEWLLEAIVRPAYDDTEQKTPTEADAKEAVAILSLLPPEKFQSYDPWLKVGMGLHHVGVDVGHWIEWSRSMPSFDEKECRLKWKSFAKYKGRRIGLGSMRRWGFPYGHRPPARLGPTFSFGSAAPSSRPRPQAIADALTHGATNAALVLLVDDCGTGKTHDVHNTVRVIQRRIPSARAVYIGDRWRLPPSRDLRYWAVVPTRHPALKDRPIEGGEVERIWCAPGETGDINPSCSFPYRIRSFAALGGSLGSITEACQACPLRDGCTYAANDARFKSNLRKSHGMGRILAPPHLLGRLKALSPVEQWAKTFLFIDEFSSLTAALTTTYSIPWARLGVWSSWLRTHREAEGGLINVVAALQDLPHHFEGKAAIWGLTHAELRSQMACSGTSRLAIGETLALDVGVGDVEHDPGAPLLLDPILDALEGINGTVRASSTGLELNVPSDAVREALKGCGGVVLMDATVDQQEAIQALLGPDTDMRVEVVQTVAPNDLSNITFIQVGDLGAMGGQRRPALTQRRNALVNAIKARHGGKAGVIDLKAHRREGESYWFRHHRASNAFAGHDALILIGLPRPNIADLLARVDGDTSSDPDVQIAMAAEMGRELWQAVHRLRSARRPDQALTIYLICNDPMDGMPFSDRIQHRKASDFTADAAGSFDRLVNAIRQNPDITQEQAAAVIGCTPRHVKRIVHDSGLSWRDFRRQHQRA